MKKITGFLFAALLLVCILSAIPMAYAYAAEGYSTWDFVRENWFVMTIVSLVVTAIAGFILINIHNSANNQLTSKRYLTENGYYKVLDKQEVYERTYETVQRNYYKQKEAPKSANTKK